MERLPATRTSLLELESKQRIASQGRDLLREKREALARVVFEMAKGVLGGRERLEQCLREAARALTAARALEGDDWLESLALAARREIGIRIGERNVWGIPTYELEGPKLTRTVESRGASPLAWSITTIEATHLHEKALEILLEISTSEILLRRLGEEIRRTSRRINALEQVVIPSLEKESMRVALALAEGERESLVQLKRFKAMRR